MRVPRRLAIHTLIAVGVSFAVVGCGTLRASVVRRMKITPPGGNHRAARHETAGREYVLEKPDGTIVYPPGHPLAKTNPGQLQDPPTGQPTKPASQPVRAVNAGAA